MSKKLPAGWIATGEFDPADLDRDELMDSIIATARSASTMMLCSGFEHGTWSAPEDTIERLSGDDTRAEAVQEYLTTLARLLNEQERRWDTEDGGSR
ncbi:MAG: hypothetical protein L0K34_02215 [Ancrocorticia sp.]|nr:hypothetical protein [Ancrocorticia sp.]